MNAELNYVRIDLENLVSGAQEDFDKKFWANYENYLEQYNSILDKLHNMELFHGISHIEEVPSGQRAFGPGFSYAERAKLREVLNASRSLAQKLESLIKKREREKPQKTEIKSNKVFVVHGRDEEMKQTVARTLGKLELDPIILHEKPHKGRTIIEKFTDYSDVSFAVVLLSPDDLAYQKDEKPENAKFRARQNVIFELGYFIGKLGRKNVLAIYRETDDFEIPTDYSGVLWIPFKEGWQLELVRELNACNYGVDANKLV